MPEAAIEIENLTKEYPFGFLNLKKRTSLEGLNMQVKTGEVFGFIGPNGGLTQRLRDVGSALSGQMDAIRGSGSSRLEAMHD